MNTHVRSSISFQLLWNGESHAELSVPGNYKRKMCGLCGNFNGYPQDDLRTRSGQITASAAIFGNSWKVCITINVLRCLPKKGLDK